METYGKPSADLNIIKDSFVSDNNNHLKDAHNINKNYILQPRRTKCKVCNHALGLETDFASHGVEYIICDKCSHLNGAFEDTAEFSTNLYSNDSGKNYSSNYLNDYNLRVKNIYKPKVDFLLKVLGQINDQQSIDLVDYGCGAGHFVNACLRNNINALGLDISKDLINLAIQMNQLEQYPQRGCFAVVENENKLLSHLRSSSSKISSFIGVIEHLRNPNDFFQAFVDSSSKYLYISIPLFSLSVFLEHSFQTVYPRHLSGGHTHLFTYESIKYLLTKHGLKKVAAWNFGADIVDLKRSISVIMSQNNASKKALQLFNSKILDSEIVDKLQLVLDSAQLNSEVHLIISKE